ncbi:ARF GTPase-activating protein GIT2-like isoform X2 [Glandiceps talaboti]
MAMRGKQRTPGEICADCGAPDPGWASINHGILICDECCSVHRSLGRHISQVRPLHHGPAWPRNLLEMVQTLVSNGANSIWEHSLLDPSQVRSGKRKPSPKDSVHPTKSDFIRAKYQRLDFVHRLPSKDDDAVTAKDLSKQLHSSVRTGNLETCLRLLSLGAQANFFHPDKGNTPLHVAAKAGQSLQAELLIVYGADPGSFDVNGKSPLDYAKQEGHLDLAERLVECQYELTDKLAYYLCGRKPDHTVMQHFIVPEMADSSLDRSELAKAAKMKLQALPNHLFEELAMDVYDEVDRRELDAVWLATQNHSAIVNEKSTVPFLPVNPEFSSTRNQGRQKLARFNAREFATLIIDILNDARRRSSHRSIIKPIDLNDIMSFREPPPAPPPVKSQTLDVRHLPGKVPSTISDDEPLYDSVASDDDTDLEAQLMAAEETNSPKTNKRPESMASSDVSDGPITLEEYLEVKKALASSEAKVQQLIVANKNMTKEITLLQSVVQKLMQENSQLRTQTVTKAAEAPTMSNGHDSSQNDIASNTSRSSRSQGRPQSMFEPRVQQRQNPWTSEGDKVPSTEDILADVGTLLPGFQDASSTEPVVKRGGRLGSSSSSTLTKVEERVSQCESDYDNTSLQQQDDVTQTSSHEAQSHDSQSAAKHSEASGSGGTDTGQPGEEKLPSQEAVVRKTEQVTKKIQELLIAAQEGKHDRFIPCADNIHQAVSEMADLFPGNPWSENMALSLKLLLNSASRLQAECKAVLLREPCSTIDFQLVTQMVIQCAYDIAKAAKQVVTLVQ